MLFVTPLYAGLVGLLIVALSARVILARNRFQVSLGDGGEAELQRRVRVQGNCTEYAPLGVLLLALAELQGLPVWQLHLLGSMLILGRIVHAWGVSQAPQVLPARIAGMGLTLTMIGLASLANITLAVL